MGIRSFIVLALVGTVLTGCGSTTGDRGLSGAAIGAGAGVAAAAIFGAPLAAGALVGAAAGAATGVVTTPSQVDLGKPIWER